MSAELGEHLSPEERLASIAGRSPVARTLLEADYAAASWYYAVLPEVDSVLSAMTLAQKETVGRHKNFFVDFLPRFIPQWGDRDMALFADSCLAAGFQIEDRDDAMFFSQHIVDMIFEVRVFNSEPEDVNIFGSIRTLLNAGVTLSSQEKGGKMAKGQFLAKFIKKLRPRRRAKDAGGVKDKQQMPIDPKYASLSAFVDYIDTLGLPVDKSATQEMGVFPNYERHDEGGVVDPKKYSAFADFVDTLDLDDFEDQD